MSQKVFKVANLKKTVRYLKKNGLKSAYYAAKERIETERKDCYFYHEPALGELRRQREETSKYPYLFSIVVPTYETKEIFLREMIASVQQQSYENWELLLMDASQSPVVKNTVETILAENDDKRIKYTYLGENKGISENTNAGIKIACGDYIALLDHDDFLAPDALYYMAKEVAKAKQEKRSLKAIYTDEDKFENNTRSYTQPHVKTSFNLDLLLSNNYICHFLAVESELMKSLCLREKFDGAQDYDLMLRAVDMLWKKEEKIKFACEIIHIPRVLYHWRCHSESTADNTASKSYAYEAGKNALLDFCTKRGWNVSVEHGKHLGFYNVIYHDDLFLAREEAGIIGGKILNKQNRICAGMYDETGNLLFEGLHANYSGGIAHRASMRQDAVAVDIRFMRLRPELWQIYQEVVGIPYREKATLKGENDSRFKRKVSMADVSELCCDEAGYRKISMELCKAITEAGYLVIWDPEWTLLLK